MVFGLFYLSWFFAMRRPVAGSIGPRWMSIRNVYMFENDTGKSIFFL
jgi:hypothetical protein